MKNWSNTWTACKVSKMQFLKMNLWRNKKKKNKNKMRKRRLKYWKKRN